MIKFQKSMKWIRLVHGYLGLFLIPWILLYGVTGFLFNHPDFFAEHEVFKLNLRDIPKSSLNAFPNPDSAANEALRLCAGNFEKKGAQIQMAPDSRPEYTEAARFSAHDPQKDFYLIVDPSRETALLRAFSKPAKPELSKPVWVDLNNSIGKRMENGAEEVCRNAGYTKGSLKWENGPLLRFKVLVNGSPYRALYDMGQGRFQISPETGWSSAMTMRSFLARLHRYRGYPENVNIAFFWAIFVDLTTLSMVMWALTGVILWFWRKNYRRSGVVILLAGLFCGFALACSLWRLFR